jgi:hypothetical protein
MKIKIFFLLIIILQHQSVVFAQQNTVGAAIEATGSGGTVSASIGQIDYMITTGSGGSGKEGLHQPTSPCPTVTASNVVACPSVAISLVGSPLGGTFSVANPYLGPATNYTYTYVDPSIGCSVTSSPASISVSNMTAPIPLPATVTTNTAAITWPAVAGATIYYVWYRAVGSLPWFTPTTAGTSITLTSLLPNTVYEFKIRCNNATCSQLGSFGALYNFTTFNSPCGTATTFITPFALTNTTALVKWNGLVNVAQYSLWYKKTSDVLWTTLTLTGSTIQYLLTGLSPNTAYDVKIRNRCNSVLTFTPFGSVYQFGTPLKPSPNSDIASLSISAYPNPTSDIIYIELEATNPNAITFKLLDMMGKLMLQTTTNTSKGLNHVSIDLKPFANGNYTLQVHDESLLLRTIKVSKQD